MRIIIIASRLEEILIIRLSRRTVVKGASSIAGLSLIAGFPVVFSPALAGVNPVKLVVNPVKRPLTRKPSRVRTQKSSGRPLTRKPSRVRSQKSSGQNSKLLKVGSNATSTLRLQSHPNPPITVHVHIRSPNITTPHIK